MAEAFLIGSWTSLSQMEECLTLEELNLIVSTARERTHHQQKFAAALKGIDLDKKEDTASFEDIQNRAAAALAGKSEDEYDLSVIGIEVDDDEED